MVSNRGVEHDLTMRLLWLTTSERILSYHGLGALLLDCSQYFVHAIYCGSRITTATANPPSPVVDRRRTLLR